MRPEAIDLSDGRAFAAGFPHAFFTWLRDNEPVFWHEPTAVSPDGDGFWVVSRYEDVREIQTRPDDQEAKRRLARLIDEVRDFVASIGR